MSLRAKSRTKKNESRLRSTLQNSSSKENVFQFDSEGLLLSLEFHWYKKIKTPVLPEVFKRWYFQID